MLKLSIIGCGNVGKTMGYLWHQSSSVEIMDVVNRSQQSADESVAFIDAGKALDSITKIRSADLFVIACGDDQIESCLDELIATKMIQANTIIFHFSGAKSSEALNKAVALGAKCASLHPVKSFANPSDAVKSFERTYCGLEGDAAACEVLKNLIENIGGHCFEVDAENKLIYHSASVFACNYLTALQELSIQAFEQSGVERELAMKILEPIVKETSNNIFKLGTADALTGPVARGDVELVEKQLSAVNDWNKDAAEIYRLLGKLSTKLADEKGVCEKEEIQKLKKLLF